MKTPLQKATTVIDIVDASVDIMQPIATLVIIDEERLEREVLKGSIADSDVQKLLPFATVISEGLNFRHILNMSSYTVETNSHNIHEGETLCKRESPNHVTYYGEDAVGTPTCPGCLAKGKTIIINHLL